MLIFLDAHMECCDGWLLPLLARIASDRAVIAVPLIDGISSDDMTYSYNPDTFINGFSWSLAFNWYASSWLSLHFNTVNSLTKVVSTKKLSTIT